jgi:thioredoxin reductase
MAENVLIIGAGMAGLTAAGLGASIRAEPNGMVEAVWLIQNHL